MMGNARTGVRRMSRVETRAKWKALARRVRQLWGRLPADTVPERIERYTSLDNQLDIEAEAVVTELENDCVKALSKPTQQRNTLEAALELHHPDILGMSALLTTTMPYMKVVIQALKDRGMREDYIVLVGGAPLNEEFGLAVGADAYCRDAGVAAETARRLIDERRARVA